MTSIEARIQAAAAQNAELLQTLKNTDHAAPDLNSQNKYIADLERLIVESAVRIKKLGRKRNKELEEHESYRDSVMRRFAYKATGRREKFAQKAEKEEKEYFDVLQECQREAEARRGLEEMMKQAHESKGQLEVAARRNRQAQADLDGLYDSIFAGPTPAFPEEDQREEAARQARDRYQQARVPYEGELRASQLLQQAQLRMVESTKHIQDAVSASHMDMFGGGTLADAMERSALHKADVAVREARMLAMQASMQSPMVNLNALPDVEVAQGNIISDVFFDNIFTDMAFHEKIRTSEAQVNRCLEAHKKLTLESKQRCVNLQQEMKEREVMLESARFALQEARADLFRRVGGTGAGAVDEKQPIKS